MGIAGQIEGSWEAALAALSWQVDLGVAEVVQDSPQVAFDLPEAAPWDRRARAPAPAAPAARQGQTPTTDAPRPVDAVAEAAAAAAACGTLDALREAIASFPHCDLKKGARNTVFSDGNPRARVLILGEAPGREEDLEGRPFVGQAGQLLDRMFAAIGLSRTAPDAERALYITNVMPWRPPGNRDPEAAEIAMMRPFVEHHIGLVDPAVIVVMGNTPLDCLTGTRGILRARGRWTQALGRPVMPMTHPAYLLRNPEAKREAWADLLEIKARL